MQVSRPIEHKELKDFPLAERFLKLPIDNYLNLLGITPSEPQIAVINAINDSNYRFIVACLSRRVGKSFIAYNIAFLKALEPGVKILIMAPNYSISNIGWSAIKNLIKNYGLDVEKENAKDKEIELSNGTLIKLGSVNQADSVVGHSFDLVIYEEAAIASKGGDSFNVQIRPMLDKPNSKALFISTPRGANWFKEFYERGYNPLLPQWLSIHATWKDNPRVSETDIDEARRTVSPAFFRQEYEADFDVFEGMVFTAFDYEKHVKDPWVELTKETCETIMGIDHGYNDPTAAIVLKYHFDTDTFFLVSEYQDCKKTTDVYAEQFRRMIDEYGVELTWVDSAAAQFRQDLMVLHDICSAPATKSVLDGIEYVHSLIAQDKLIISPECAQAILSIKNYSWEESETLQRSRPTHDEYSHICDALRYALYSYAR